MWYPRLYASTTLCSTADGRRTGSPRSWAAVRQGFHRSPLPYSPCERRRAAYDRDCQYLTVQRSDCPQYDPRLSRPWARRAPAHILPTAYDPSHFRCRRSRTAPGALTPESARFWQGDQCLDPGAGGRGQLRAGADTPACQRRNHPRCHGPAWRPLEACQALDDQPRPGVPPKKNRRDRLMHWASTRPTWGLGWADEVWWSRLVQPEQHRWIEAGSVPRLYALESAKDDADPKALACYGLLLRCSPQHADHMLLRFVEGRPVSTVTIAFLTWCSERLAA